MIKIQTMLFVVCHFQCMCDGMCVFVCVWHSLFLHRHIRYILQIWSHPKHKMCTHVYREYLIIITQFDRILVVVVLPLSATWDLLVQL